MTHHPGRRPSVVLTAAVVLSVFTTVVGGADGIVSAGLVGVGSAVGSVIVAVTARFLEDGGLRHDVWRWWAGRHGGRARTCWRGGPEVGVALRLAARLMPATAGRRWLGEARSFLYEVTPELRRRAGRDYLRTAPWVIVMAWAAELARGTQALARRRRA